MGVKLLNDCSHKINRAPGHSSSPRQKRQQARVKKSRKQEKTSGITGLERRQAAGAGVDAGITAVKTLCLLSPTHSPQDERKQAFCAGLGTVCRYMKRYNRSYRILSTLRLSSPPKCPHHLPTGFPTEMKGLCSPRALHSLFAIALWVCSPQIWQNPPL